jgi:hypothetical protein
MLHYMLGSRSLYAPLHAAPPQFFLFPFLYFHIKPAIVCCFSIPFPRTIFHYMFIPEIDNNRGLQNWNRRNKDFRLCHGIAFIRARTDYANRACNVTCNVMLVAKLVPRTADEPSAQRTASILRSLIDRTPFHRHRDEGLCYKKSNSAHNICISLIHTRRINNSTSFRFTAVILLTTS